MFYGWKIVASLFVTLAFSSGLGFYNHSVILQALASEKGFPVTIASTAVSVFFLAGGIAGLVIAALLEKFDVRLIVSVGAMLASLSLGVLGEVTTQWQLIAVYIVFGIGFSASGLLPATTLIARWFHKSRARALSVASTGLSVGGILITPASATLIESQGMVIASPVMGLVYFLGVLPLSLLVLRSHPADLDLRAEGEASRTVADKDSGPVRGAAQLGISLAKARRDGYFWRLNCAYVFVMLAQVGAIAHQYGIVSEVLAPGDAALALGVLPLFSIIGRLAGGVIIDHIDAGRFTLMMMLLQTMSLALMGLMTGPIGLILGLALFGITVGNLLMLQPLLIANRYGLLAYSRIYALANLLTMAGIAAGPVTMGYLYALTDSYGAAYLTAAGAGLIAFLIFFKARNPPAMIDC